MPEMQTIPARHGVATFVPAGQTIKIVNTSGHQVVDTWAFALPHPDVKNGEDQKQGQQEPPKKEELQKEEKKEDEKSASTPNKKNRRKSGMDLPTQEEAEKATKEGLENGDGQQQQQQQQPKKSSWSSYVPSVPSIGWSSSRARRKSRRTRGLGARTCRVGRVTPTISPRVRAILSRLLRVRWVASNLRESRPELTIDSAST
jgi:hypothetical protein